MKFIYKIMMIGMFCLLSNQTHAQIVQYSDDGTQTFMDGKSTEVEGGGFEITCDCWSPVEFLVFEQQLSLSEIAEREYLDTKRDIFTEEIESRLNEEFSNYREAQESFFNTINVLVRGPANGYYNNLENYWENEIPHDDDGYKENVKDLTLLEAYKEDKERLGNGEEALYDFGTLRLNGESLNSDLDHNIDELSTIVSNQFQNRKALFTYLGKIAYAEENEIFENIITDHLLDHYYAHGYKDEIKLMTKYLIIENGGSSVIDHAALSGLPEAYDPGAYDFTETFTDRITSIPTSAISEITPYNASVEDAMFDAGLDMVKATSQSFTAIAEVETELRNVLERQNYSAPAFDMIEGALDSYAGGLDQEWERVTFHLSDTPNSYMRYQVATNQDRAFQMRYGSGEDIENRQQGIGNLLYQLSHLDDAAPEVTAVHIRNMLRDSTDEFDLYDYFTIDQINALFELQYVAPYTWVSDEVIRVHFAGDIGQTLWGHGLTFPDWLAIPYAVEGAIALSNEEEFDFEFRGMVYDLVNTLDLDGTQENWLIAHEEQGRMLNTFIQNQTTNNQIPEDVKTLAGEIIEFGLANTSNDLANNITNDILTTLNNNTSFDISQYIKNENFIETGYIIDGSCCLSDEFIMADPLYGSELGIDMINNAVDGFGNLMIAFFTYGISDTLEGEIIRKLIEKMGVEIEADVDDQTLGELYQIKKRDRNIVVEYETGFVTNLIDLGFSTLDVVTILSPSRGAGAYLAVNGGNRITAIALRNYLLRLKNIAETTLAGGRGYRTFDAFKKAEGNASSGNALHHIVEQNGFQGLNPQKFGKVNIHNTKNILDIPTGNGTLHDNVTRYYGRIHDFTDGKRFREWIKDKTFKEQYEIGLDVLRQYGWDGITGVID
ncbi:hypothetical protein [Aquimarina pacifica]|uniref:hypothetical protein n=1 Tax=Aquimarina pacifica TaxID=1296415 RepID=UPI001267F812|nr:hypothetical protein [Aquimarina pacifica]